MKIYINSYITGECPMSDEIEFSEDINNMLEDFEKMDINVDNLCHITLLNGTEFIAEIVDEKRKKSDDIIFLYPVKILKDNYFDEFGDYNPSFMLVEYNLCTKQPYIPLNPSGILSIVPLTFDIMNHYIEAIKVYYFSDIFFNEDLDIQKSIVVKKDNVIDFNKFKSLKNK